jgi:pimeloyl-ACP methyl ester carboxylesterase
MQGLSVSLRTPSRLAPHQLRPLTLEINQTEALPSDVTKLNLVVSTSVGDVALALPLAHYRSRRSATVRFVFRDRDGTAAYAEAHPPTNSDGPQDAVVLALHGAGVETDSAFWTDAVAPRPRSWILFPTGRTAWGYDWHAASTENVWAARRELSRLLVSLGKEPLSDRNIVIGHSNGGQGATHVFLHHPDEFHAALSAAAYIKIQAYVPYTQWTSAHHVDPALLGLLMTGLAGNDEDVLAPNGFGLGRALVHGREDDNVSPGRKAIWTPSSDLDTASSSRSQSGTVAR